MNIVQNTEKHVKMMWKERGKNGACVKCGKNCILILGIYKL